MELHKGELQAAGLQIVAIGLGEPKHAQRYCAKLSPSFQQNCLTDTSNTSHEAWGLKHLTFGSMMTPSFIKAGARSTLAGYFPETPTGDTFMMPGTFIIDRERQVQFAFYSAHPGEHPEISALVSAASALKQTAR